MKLILLRHGESEWNLENRFTGWEDVGLTNRGQQEALFSAKQIIKQNLKICTIHTSLLKRAIQTTEIIIDKLNFPKDEINFEWRLNERHYGALQGLNKSETAKKYGEKKVLLWRRSYDIPPPLLLHDDKRHPKFNKNFKDIDCELPVGESLKNVVERLSPFLDKYMDYIKNNQGDHLIVAHSNSLRAIIKILDKLSDKEIISVNIPTGVPLVYTLDNNFNVITKEYLIDKAKLKKKQNIVANQGKAK
jgi:2,3-bisphosphoglycerate-dependent phosphoglycerate mutase